MIEVTRVGTLVLVAISSLLIYGTLQKEGTKKYRFILGEFSVLTAIAYAFSTAYELHPFSPFGVIIWLLVATANFKQAIWNCKE